MLILFSESNCQVVMEFGKPGGTRLDEVDHLYRLYGDPTWPDGQERIRDAFIYVINRFQNSDVRHVTGFMCVGSHYKNSRHNDYSPWLYPQYFYPGDDYIGWVGQSACFMDPDVVQNIRQEDLATSSTEVLEPGCEEWDSVPQRRLFIPNFWLLGDSLFGQAHMIEQVFGQVLPRFVRIKVVTVAEFKIAKKLYEVPRLATFDDETATWKRAVRDNPHYISRSVFRARE